MTARDILRAKDFRRRAARALRDAPLQRALANVPVGFVAKRKKAMRRLPEFARLTAQVAAMRRAALARADSLLARFTEQAEAAGARVHLARDAGHARAIITSLLQRRGARLVVKGKSMTAEEIGLNAALEQAGMEVVETDLGEYIIQLRREPPSHIVAPAIHLRIADIAEDFRSTHGGLPADRSLDTAQALAAEARSVLREKFLAADAGITGANALIADTGQVMLITNEGNGDLCASNPHMHIVVAGVEKLVPDWPAALDIVRVLPRSATGQDITVYATFHGGVRRAAHAANASAASQALPEADGPEEMHIVLLADNRREMLRGEFAEMLACIRCGACLNHCPVYQLTGGHAYGNVYSGPMGIVLGRAVFGLRGAGLLVDGVEQACTMCNRCAEVCPSHIDLPGLIRRWRVRAVAAGNGGRLAGLAQKLHAALAARPWRYRRAVALGARTLRLLRRWPGLARRLPGLRQWMQGRALPEATGETFLQAMAGKVFEAEGGCAPLPSLPALLLREEGSKKEREGSASGRIIPARALVSGEEAVAQFAEQAAAAGTRVHRLASPADVPAAVRNVLDAMKLKQRAHVAEPLAGGMAWEGIDLKPFAPDVPVAVLPCPAATAETGTLVLTSGAMWPVRACLLPEVLFVVLRSDDICGGYEQAIAHALGVDGLEDLPAVPDMPRSIMLITGPSRTADVEQTLVIGAHGPKAVHVLLLETG